MPNTIAENLSRLVTAKTNIANAITTMGGTVNSGDGFEEFPADIATIPSGGGGGTSIDKSDVNFYDYDGTIVVSYTATEFAQLSAMPSNPTHAGLTAQGWNWSLADAKAHVAKYGSLNIGQMYITSDGKTRLYFTATKNNLHVELPLVLGSDTELDIDWGDGSEHTRWTSNDGVSYQYHNYASAGKYVIAIAVVTGEFSLSQTLLYIYKIEIGNGVTSIGSDTFSSCYTLLSATIPDSVTSIGDNAFHSCYALPSITIPDSVTSIGNQAFFSCSFSSSITIPNSVTSIGSEAFSYCRLSSITIPNSVTSIGDGVFTYCTALPSITIPDSVTSIGYNAFSDCDALSSITIPDSVTSIGYNAFESCDALSSITIPDSVTSIDESDFSSCYALSSITFESSAPPNLNGSFKLPDACIIRVPQGSLSSYTSAANYPDSSEYIYEEY